METAQDESIPHNNAGSMESRRPRSSADYPRKRVAIAVSIFLICLASLLAHALTKKCAVCRTRRSKCDARKPSCSRCVELGTECEYRQPGLWDRTSASVTQSSLEKLDARLSQIQEALDKLSNTTSQNTSSQSPNSTAPVTNTSRQFQTCLPPMQCPPHWATSPTGSGFQTGSLRGHRMPNLFTFSPPILLEQFSYDGLQAFFETELDESGQLFSDLDDKLQSMYDINLSPRTCWRLQRSFITHFLRWVPIFDDDTCLKYVQTATDYNHRGKSPDVCLSLLIYAIGAIAEDDAFYQRDFRNLPGYSYMVFAYRILDGFRFASRDIKHLQCRILLSAYMCFAMRPVQAWNAISQASRDFMLFLKTNWRVHADQTTVGLVERIYWVIYIMENELEICLELQTSSSRTVSEELPLPLSTYEEEGMYYFLAMATHRKLLVEVMDTIGFKSGAAHYLPIMAIELRKQLDDWYNHLPASIKFPRDTSTLYDLRRANLRGQYFAIIIIMYWPFVLRYVQSSSTPAIEEQIPFDRSDNAQVRERVKECMQCCCVFLKATKEILLQKTFCAHLNLRATYAFTMILILGQQPVFEPLELPDYTEVINQSIKILAVWQEVPFMQEPLNRISQFSSDIAMTGTE